MTGNVRTNVKLGRVRANTVAVEKKYCIFWVCVCSHSYPECNAHAPKYIVICSLLAVQYFTTLCHKRQDFRGKIC